MAENALLRQQLIILRRHVKRPVWAKTDRMLLSACFPRSMEAIRRQLHGEIASTLSSGSGPNTGIREHNQQVKVEGTGVRILPFLLPTQSPWLISIEPKWVHGKRNVVEPSGLLSAKPFAERICAYFGCSYEPHLSLPEKVA